MEWNLGICQRLYQRIENGRESRDPGHVQKNSVLSRTRDQKYLRVPPRHLRQALQ